MKYSTGCAFNVSQLLYNLNVKKLTFSGINKITSASAVFVYSVKLVLDDIIDNNITFNLPTGARKCNIHMRKVQGESLKKLMKVDKWPGLDVLSTYFTGYEINIYLKRRTHIDKRTIYIDNRLKQRIIDKANTGFQYGDSVNDKTIVNYYDAVAEKFPKIPKNDIKYILNFGWKSVYLHLSYGGDICISNQKFWSYIGRLHHDSIEHFEYYIKKLAVKIRVLHRKKKIPWDGYYYFALFKSQYEEIFGNTKKRGRPKTRCVFKNVELFCILDECLITRPNAEYIFRIPYITYMKPSFTLRELKTNKARLLMVRKPLKFKDILVSSNKYDCI